MAKSKKTTNTSSKGKKKTSANSTAEKIIKKVSKLSKKQILILALVVVVVCTVIVVLYVTHPEYFSFLTPPPSENENINGQIGENLAFEAHFIDVGQGDAILLRFSDGTEIMIDAGSATTGITEIRASVSDYLNNLGLDSIDCMIITHPDTDHYNIAEDVMDQYEVRRIIYNDVAKNEENLSKNQSYTDFIDRADQEIVNKDFLDGIDADGEDYVINGNSYSINIYSPGYNTFGNGNSDYDAEESNGMSPITIVSCAGRNLVLTGDAIVETEEWFMSKIGGTKYDCDFLKVGHHGSVTSSSEEFLDYVDCEYAIILVDDGTKHRHPDEEVMDRLNDRSIPTYTTNTHGNIVLRVDIEGNFAFYVEKDNVALNNKDNVSEYRELLPAA